jgi:hypothetical protein
LVFFLKPNVMLIFVCLNSSNLSQRRQCFRQIFRPLGRYVTSVTLDQRQFWTDILSADNLVHCILAVCRMCV